MGLNSVATFDVSDDYDSLFIAMELRAVKRGLSGFLRESRCKVLTLFHACSVFSLGAAHVWRFAAKPCFDRSEVHSADVLMRKCDVHIRS